MKHIFSPSGLNHLTLRVNNLERAEQFYCQTLGFDVEKRMGKTMMVLRVGTDSIVLVEAETAYDKQSRDYRVDHFGFTVDSAETVDAIAKYLKEKEVAIVSGPGNRKNGRFIFFTDHDGNMIEIFWEK